MTRVRWVVAACALVLTGAGCSNTSTSNKNINPEVIQADIFLIPELFDASWATSIGKDVACKSFRGGVVNHHALASDLLAGFFRTLKRCRPDVAHFIILSPDHFDASVSAVATHDLSYRVRGQEIRSDVAALATEQPRLFEREHGVGALVPFLAHEFPTSTVTPVAVKTSIGERDAAALSVWLKGEFSRPGAFLIVSSDMSHYLSEQRAESNDQETKRALERGDADFFARANDDYTDNGPSIAAAMSALAPSNWHLIAQSISSRYKGSPGFTTSYLVGFWE